MKTLMHIQKRVAMAAILPCFALSTSAADPITVTKTTFEWSIPSGEEVYVSFDFEATGGVVEDEYDYKWSLAEGSTLPGEGLYLTDSGFLSDGYLSDADYGTNQFDVVVTDKAGTKVTQTITFIVKEDLNHTPVITDANPEARSSQTIRVGDTPSFSMKASDPDGDELTITWAVYQDDPENDDDVKIRDLVPQADGSVLFPADMGESNGRDFEVRCTVSDGAREAKTGWYVGVVSILIDQDLPHAVEGQPYEVQLHATGGKAPYKWSTSTDTEDEEWGVTEDGVLTATIGIYDWDFGPTRKEWYWICVEDSEGQKSWQSIPIVVEAAVMIDSVTPDSYYDVDNDVVIAVGQSQTFSVEAHDQEGKPLTYEWWFEDMDNKPLGDPLDCDGSEWTWTPTESDIGQRWLVMSVSNGIKMCDHRWSIEVVAAPGPDNPEPPAPATITVTFDANGGTGTMSQTLPVDQEGALQKCTFVKDGFTFVGWTLTKDGALNEIPVYGDGATVKFAADTTLYARYAKNAYTVKFSKNGGKGKMKAQKRTYGKKAKLSANKFTRKGWVFTGWSTTKKGTTIYKNKAKVDFASETGTVTLYARWAKENYKVKFYKNGGTGTMKAQSMTYGKKAKLSANKFKAPAGMKFAGWAKTSADAAAVKVAYMNKKSVKNILKSGKTAKLYAVWVAK